MRKLKVLIGAFVLCLTLAYLCVVLGVNHVPSANGSVNPRPGYYWQYLDTCNNLEITSTSESPSCASTIASTNHYQFSVTIKNHASFPIKLGAFASYWCTKGSGWPCNDNKQTNASDQNYTLAAGASHTFTYDRSPGKYNGQQMQACGTYQTDLEGFSYHDSVKNKQCYTNDKGNTDQLVMAWGGCQTYGQPGTSSSNRDCTTLITPTQSPTPTPPHIIVKKHVINDNGGTKSAGDFQIYVKNATTGDPITSFLGSEGGQTITMQAGVHYHVYEGNHDGYDASSTGDCDATTSNGQTYVCTIINNDIANTPTPTPTYGVTPTPSPTVTITPTKPHILVYKYVQGAKHSHDFTMHVTGNNVSRTSFPGNENGTLVILDSGRYSVTEDQLDGYTLTGRSAACSGYIADGQTKTCVMVNTQNGVTPTPPSTNTNGCNSNQSNNNGGNNNSNCNSQEQHQEQNQYNNNNQTVNISYATQQQVQPQVLGVSYPVYANSLPSTGPAETWALIGALTPLGFILRKISGK